MKSSQPLNHHMQSQIYPHCTYVSLCTSQSYKSSRFSTAWAYTWPLLFNYTHYLCCVTSIVHSLVNQRLKNKSNLHLCSRSQYLQKISVIKYSNSYKIHRFKINKWRAGHILKTQTGRPLELKVCSLWLPPTCTNLRVSVCTEQLTFI